MCHVLVCKSIEMNREYNQSWSVLEWCVRYRNTKYMQLSMIQISTEKLTSSEYNYNNLDPDIHTNSRWKRTVLDIDKLTA